MVLNKKEKNQKNSKIKMYSITLMRFLMICSISFKQQNQYFMIVMAQQNCKLKIILKL